MSSCDRPLHRASSVVDDAAMSAPFRQAQGPELVEGLLHEVRVRFYAAQPASAFQRDRRRLIHALTWPAVWLERRGLYCSQARYHALVTDRLVAILAHGDPSRYGGPSPTASSGYFPAYLLKCLQDFFDRHGDELYRELKHVRNALDVVLGSLRFVEKASAQSRQIEALAQAHRFLRANAHAPSDPSQMALF